MQARTAQFAIHVEDTLGASPERCIELLHIRSLLFGAAWKVLDLLVEEALLLAGEPPDQGRGFKVDTKRQKARAGVGKPTFFKADIWTAATTTYDLTAELRNSLVHRRVYEDSSGALVGQDRGGGNLRPLSTREQDAFTRAVLRLSEIAASQSADDRAEADLSNLLGVLTPIHRVQLLSFHLPSDIPEIAVVLDAASDDPNSYELDIPYIRQRNPFPDSPYSDLIVEFRDRPGVTLRGRLENAPNGIVTVTSDRPPDWLT